MQLKKSWIILGVIALVFLMLFGWFKGTYNGFVLADEGVGKAWGNVESTYQRRSDLIPNLVETVKGYASHEKETLTTVTEARSRVGQVKIDAANLDPAMLGAFTKAQQGLSGALSKLLVVAERYPDLKANQNFLDLQAQLEGTENRINVARTRFNEAVGGFNSRIRTFPGNFMAAALGFTKKPYFEAQAGTETAPAVKF